MDKLLSSGQKGLRIESPAVPFWVEREGALFCLWSGQCSHSVKTIEETFKKNCSESFWCFDCHQGVQKQN
jgi:hypothetical protein